MEKVNRQLFFRICYDRSNLAKPLHAYLKADCESGYVWEERFNSEEAAEKAVRSEFKQYPKAMLIGEWYSEALKKAKRTK